MQETTAWNQDSNPNPFAIMTDWKRASEHVQRALLSPCSRQRADGEKGGGRDRSLAQVGTFCLSKSVPTLRLRSFPSVVRLVAFPHPPPRAGDLQYEPGRDSEADSPFPADPGPDSSFPTDNSQEAVWSFYGNQSARVDGAGRGGLLLPSPHFN